MPKKIKYTDHAKMRLAERQIQPMKGCELADDTLRMFIKERCPLHENEMKHGSGFVYWYKRYGVYLEVYVTVYEEIGEVLVITAFKIPINEYRSFIAENLFKILNEEIDKNKISKIIAGSIKSVKNDHGKILVGSVAKRAGNTIVGNIRTRFKECL